jgi:hypothetical protein
MGSDCEVGGEGMSKASKRSRNMWKLVQFAKVVLSFID